MSTHHYHWRETSEGRGGRIAVKTTSDRFELRTLAGVAPPAGILHKVVSEKDFNDAMLEHYKRKNHFCVEKRVGMSGCIDLRLRICRDEDWEDYPIASAIHISMYGKLNDGVNIPFMDIPPLLEKIPHDTELETWEAAKFEPVGWIDLKKKVVAEKCDEKFHGVSVAELKDPASKLTVGFETGCQKIWVGQPFGTDFFITPEETSEEKWKNAQKFLNYRGMKITALSDGWYTIDAQEAQ